MPCAPLSNTCNTSVAMSIRLHVERPDADAAVSSGMAVDSRNTVLYWSFEKTIEFPRQLRVCLHFYTLRRLPFAVIGRIGGVVGKELQPERGVGRAIERAGDDGVGEE